MKSFSVLLMGLLLLTSCNQTSKKQEQKTAQNTVPQEQVQAKKTAKKESTQQEPWTKDELMAPEVLAKKIKHNNLDSTLVLSIGFDNVIKGSIDLGPVEKQAKLKAFKAYLAKLPKDRSIVIYCGCCPFAKCPNIRPAFKALNEMGFTNAKLLNLSTSVKADWLDKGYPANTK